MEYRMVGNLQCMKGTDFENFLSQELITSNMRAHTSMAVTNIKNSEISSEGLF